MHTPDTTLSRPSALRIIAPYAYGLVAYLAIYLPLIVPRLPRWHAIPFVVVAPILVGYVAVIAWLGSATSWRTRVTHALGLASFFIFGPYVAGLFRAPGFIKAADGFWEPTLPLGILVYAAIMYLLLTVGAVGRVVAHHTARGALT